MSTLDLIQVHNAAGRTYLVNRRALECGEASLQVYEPCGRQAVRVALAGEGVVEPVLLESARLCPHPLDSFKVVSVEGDSWRQCCQCAPHLSAHAVEGVAA